MTVETVNLHDKEMEGVSATAAGIVPDIDMSQISLDVSKVYILELPFFFFFFLGFVNNSFSCS